MTQNPEIQMDPCGHAKYRRNAVGRGRRTRLKRFRNALRHRWAQYLVTKGRDHVRVGADFRSPSACTRFLASFTLAEGGRAECLSLSCSGDTRHAVTLPIPVEGSSSFQHSRIAVSLLLGCDYCRCALRGSCARCLHLNFRRRCRLNPDTERGPQGPVVQFPGFRGDTEASGGQVVEMPCLEPAPTLRCHTRQTRCDSRGQH